MPCSAKWEFCNGRVVSMLFAQGLALLPKSETVSKKKKKNLGHVPQRDDSKP